MCSPSAPPAPDYKGAAEATAAQNRTDQYTPWGSLTYAPNGADPQGNPQYSQTLQLSPTQQQLLDTQNQTSLGLAGLQGKGLGAVGNLFNNLPTQPTSQLNTPTLSQAPNSPQMNLGPQIVNPGQTAQDAILQREMPVFNRQQDRMNNQLANQGIQVGSEAYKNAQDDMGRQQNDLVSQAALNGIGVDQSQRAQTMQQYGQQFGMDQSAYQTGNQAAQQQLSMDQLGRNQNMSEQGFYSQLPMNMLNALRTGSQVQNPTFNAAPPGANYMQAAANQYNGQLNAYNGQVGSSNSMLNGLLGLGSTAMMMYGG